MDLKALLAANPQAQAEYDQAIKDAEARGKVAGTEEMKATVTSVAPFLSNKSYPSQVGEMALKVLTGEQQKASLDSMVAMADMMKEMQKGEWVIVPIPLFPSKLRKRGYNQSEILANELSKKFNFPVQNLLQRIKN